MPKRKASTNSNDADDELIPYAEEWAKAGLSLRKHQIVGIREMDKWYRAGHGGINADEMGLGKTCQAIVMMARIHAEGGGPFFVISPLTVCDHWEKEVELFSCGHLKAVNYIGHEEQRNEVLKNLKEFDRRIVFITSSSHYRRFDVQRELNVTFRRHKVKFSMIIVDEAQCVKNTETILWRAVHPFATNCFTLLLTGTPLQNNVEELFSLLALVDTNKFRKSTHDLFMEKYEDEANVEELREILSKYMIRRTKAEICDDLPPYEQVVLYHDMTELQKTLYLDIVSKNYTALMKSEHKKYTISLTNVLMQLRKAILHPYMFRGIEPEPFVEGEHLVEASGKMMILDRVLTYLKAKGHQCLIFSQFTTSLDIIQDYLIFRGWSYAHIDGSVRAEERFKSINRFQASKNDPKRKKPVEEDPWIFLLTTKSGGVGLNLTAADTVIFLDNDWNPQNDIQAMARCHRIGQDRPVKVIRLIGRYTVEQYVHANARRKLKFTEVVMNEQDEDLSGVDIAEMIKSNLAALKENGCQQNELSDDQLEETIGKSDENGLWVINKAAKAEEKLNPDDLDVKDIDTTDFTVFQGVQYRVSAKDEEIFKQLAAETLTGTRVRRQRVDHYDESMMDSSISSRSDFKASPQTTSSSDDSRDFLSWEKLQKFKKQIEEQKLAKSLAAAEKRRQKAQELDDSWLANGYTSVNLPLPEWWYDDKDNVEDFDACVAIRYVNGDVTRPHAEGNELKVIAIVVDDGGAFGRGGLLAALVSKCPSLAEVYEKASEMGDLAMGSAHLVRVSGDNNEAIALLVAQHSDRRDTISARYLNECFARLCELHKNEAIHVHMPRIGDGTKMSFYEAQRIVKNTLSTRGVPVTFYYRRKQHKQENKHQNPMAIKHKPSTSQKLSDDAPRGRLRGVKRRYVEESNEEDSSSASSSSDESSASENDWEDEEHDDEEVGESEDESSGEESSASPSSEENDENEDPRPVVKRKVMTKKRTVVHNQQQPSKTSNIALSSSIESDVDSDFSYKEYDSDEEKTMFYGVECAFEGVEEEERKRLSRLLETHGGCVVDSPSEATHVISSHDTSEVAPPCVAVKSSWIDESIKAGQLIDCTKFEQK